MGHLLDRNLGIVFISETWSKADSSDITSLLKIYGYRLIPEITELLEVLSATHEDIIIAGDINLHMDNMNYILINL